MNETPILARLIDTNTERKVYKQLPPLDFQQRHLIGSVLNMAEIMVKHNGSNENATFPWPEGWGEDVKLAKEIWTKAESEAEFTRAPDKRRARPVF